MKQLLALTSVVVALLSALPADARDTVQSFPVKDVIESPQYAPQLEGVAFYFGEQPHPAVERSFGEFQSNKKTNAFNKSDKGACEIAFMSALLSFHQRALSLGADAVVNIRGYYKKQPFSSTSEFQCGAGALMAGVTLKGDVVKLK